MNATPLAKRRVQRERRLARYSAVVSLAVAAGASLTTPVHADEVVINVDPDAMVNAGNPSFPIDFDQDGTPETNVKHGFYSANYIFLDTVPVPAPAWIGTTSPYNYVSAILPPDTIGASDTWQVDAVPYFGYGTNSQFANGFPGQTGRVAGVRFQLGGNTHYGWIAVDVSADSSEATVIAYGYNDTPGAATEPDLSVAVTLAEFAALSLPDGSVEISWETATEIDNAGFNVYRSTTPAFDPVSAVKLNDSLIAAQSQFGSGASYEWLDASIPAGSAYYFLEDVDLGGVTTLHGPVVPGASDEPTSVGMSGVSGSAQTLVGSLLAAATTFFFLLVGKQRRK